MILIGVVVQLVTYAKNKQWSKKVCIIALSVEKIIVLNVEILKLRMNSKISMGLGLLLGQVTMRTRQRNDGEHMFLGPIRALIGIIYG